MSYKSLPANGSGLEIAALITFWMIAITVSGLFVWLVGDVVFHGLSGVSWEFLTSEPTRFGTEGGIYPMIISTLLILLIAIAVAVPLSIASALYLSEFSRGSWTSFLIERGLIILACLLYTSPSPRD